MNSFTYHQGAKGGGRGSRRGVCGGILKVSKYTCVKKRVLVKRLPMHHPGLSLHSDFKMMKGNVF